MLNSSAMSSTAEHGWIADAEGALSGWFAGLMPPPQMRIPLTPKAFALYVVPAYLLYYAMAVLVLLPGTRPYRLALFPVTLYAIYVAASSCDMSRGIAVMNHWNYGQGVAMFIITLRVTEWSFLAKPLRRIHPLGHSPRSPYQDAVELMCNLRGLGWDWSRGLYVPRETRPTHSRFAFFFSTLTFFLRDLFIFDLSHYAIQLLSPHTFGSTKGGSIIDPFLPPVTRYTRSSAITVLSAFVIYISLTMMYHLVTVVAFLLSGMRQDPAAWPPISEAPWRATSIADFWAHRWHQTFRRSFITVGGYPARAVFGKVGGVLGVFVLSGVLHDWGIWGMGRGTDFSRLGGFFVLNGIGVILEQVWQRFTGKKVGGWSGWAWTMLWITVTGHLLIDGWLRRGLAGSQLLPPSMRPGKILLEALGYHIDNSTDTSF